MYPIIPEDINPSTVYGGGTRTVSRTKSDKSFSSIAEYLIKEGTENVFCITHSPIPSSLPPSSPSLPPPLHQVMTLPFVTTFL